MQLQKITQRIKSVNEIQKITKAMQLVASAKLNFLKLQNRKARRLFRIFEEALGSLGKKHGKFDLDFISARDPKASKQIYIVFFSSFGLCGNYNVLLNKLLRQLLSDQDKIVAFGVKAPQFLGTLKEQVVLEAPINKDTLTPQQIKEICAQIETIIQEDTEIANINLLYVKFINSLSFRAEKLELFAQPTESEIANNFTLEPRDINEFLSSIFNIFLYSAINFGYIHSKLSEMALRRNAMDSSSNNAKDLIAELRKQFNRARQASITQEISEIVAAELGAHHG